MLILLSIAFPLFRVIQSSFQEYSAQAGGFQYVGLNQYQHLFSDSLFWISVHNTFIFTLGSIALHLGIAFPIALLLNTRWPNDKIRNFFRGAFILPFLFSPPAAALLWGLLFRPLGPLNYGLSRFGVEPIAFLGDPNWALFSVMLVNCWVYFPLYMILILGGLQAIPKILYDAARVDGANWFQRFIHVTLPQMRMLVMTVILIDFATSFIHFDLVWTMTGLRFHRYPARGGGCVKPPRQRIRTILLYAITTLITLVVLFPVIFGFFTSFKPNTEIFTYPPRLLPQQWTVQPYTSVLTQQRYLRYFLNGYLISISSTLLCVFFGALAGYGLSRFRLPYKPGLMLAILALQMFPGAVLIIPYFNLSRALGIYDTYIVLILVDTTFALSLVTWLLKSYFDSIPVSLEEAALVDGCSRFRALVSIVAPLARAGFIGTGVFAFIRAWNEFMFALILTKGPERAPVTVGLAELFGQYTIQWNGVMALTVIATFPLLITFIFVQRYVIEGITSGAAN